ncbi:MAG: holo-ACP synthase [Armatimonadetes bacterium]|nr:holo-ACP synthase [Armatimonadota bacterium]
MGIDLVRISRVGSAVERLGHRFLSRVFTEGELRDCLSRKEKHRSLAARFAAKEAFMKAMGAPFPWKEMEITLAQSGQPSLIIHGKARGALEELGLRDIRVSLTHEGEYAAAVVMVG